MKTILFTPVGGTDPISENNCRDGSMLHICRVYKPDKAYIYLSSEMLDKQKKDQRYTKCLDKLCDLQGREMEYETIERPGFNRVYEFDYYYKEFRHIIDKIIEELGEDDILLLNISSGTPAMKSGLAVLKTLIDIPCKMIQVTTPVKKMNEHNHKDFDLEMMWELNEDNEDGFENRCHEISLPTLTEIKKEEMIKRHVESYDYSAALSIANTLPEKRTNRYYNLLETAYYRLMLNIKEVDKKAGDLLAELIPVRSGNGRKTFEYALQLKVKLQREEYADFIRGITPIIAELLEMALKTFCSIDIGKYSSYSKKGDRKKGKVRLVREWDERKLQGTALLNVLETIHNQTFDYKTISSYTLVGLIEHYSKDTDLKILANDLRSVEENIRNLAAHTIVSIDDDTIYQKTGFRSPQIMKKIQQMFRYTDIKATNEMWNSYDKMNEYIIGRI